MLLVDQLVLLVALHVALVAHVARVADAHSPAILDGAAAFNARGRVAGSGNRRLAEMAHVSLLAAAAGLVLLVVA
jgi:hypothetical protein